MTFVTIIRIVVIVIIFTIIRRASQRLAYEQQRAAAEAEHRRFLERNGKVPGAPGGGPPGGPPGGPLGGPPGTPGGRGYTELPSVLGRPGSYRVQRGHRNMQKTDSGAEENIPLLSDPVGENLFNGGIFISPILSRPESPCLDIPGSDSNPPAPKVKKNNPIVGFILSPFSLCQRSWAGEYPFEYPL